LGARNSVARLLDNLIEHFLLLLLYLEGLHFFMLFRTFHLFLYRTLLFLLDLSLFVDHFQGGSSVEKFFHFRLEIQVLVTFYGFVVLDSICIQFDEVANYLFGGSGRKFELDFVI